MSAVAMLWHQLRYDARRARPWLLAGGLLLAMAAYGAWPTPVLDRWNGTAFLDVLLGAALVLGSVAVVLQEAPARPDGFLAGKPVPAAVRAVSTLLLVCGGLLGAVVGVATLHLLAFDVPLRAAPALLATSAGVLALWMLVAVALASHARTVVAVLAQAVALSVALAVIGMVAGEAVQRSGGGQPLSREAWLGAMGAGVAVLVVCAFQGYRRRWRPGVGVAVTAVATGMLSAVGDRAPSAPDPWEALPVSRNVLGLSVDSVRVQPQRTAAVVVGEEEGTPQVAGPLVLWLRMTGAPADQGGRLQHLHVDLIREDGRILRVADDTERELLRGPVLAAAGRRWRGLAPREVSQLPVAVTVPDSVREALARHAAGAPGARLVRVVVAARVHLFRQRVVARLPYQGSASVRAPGVRLVTRHTRDTAGVAALTVTARALEPWLERDGGLRRLLQLNAYAVNAPGTEAVRLPARNSDFTGPMGLLPGVNVSHRTQWLRPDRDSGLAADDPWFAGAQLLLLGWERVGTAVVAANYAVPRG
jgi:hypothetical protein